MSPQTEIDPFKRDDILKWLKTNGFVPSDAERDTGYYERCYSLSHSYPCMRVGLPEGQICATVALSDGDLNDDGGRTVYLGEAYTVPAIAALWAVLNLFDYHDGRNAAFWTHFHEQRARYQESK